MNFIERNARFYQFKRAMNRYSVQGDVVTLGRFLSKNSLKSTIVEVQSARDYEVRSRLLLTSANLVSIAEQRNDWVSVAAERSFRRYLILSPGLVYRLFKIQNRLHFQEEFVAHNIFQAIAYIAKRPKSWPALLKVVEVTYRIKSEDIETSASIDFSNRITLVKENDVIDRISAVKGLDGPAHKDNCWILVHSISRKEFLSNTEKKPKHWIFTTISRDPYSALLLASLKQSPNLFAAIASLSGSEEITDIANSLIAPGSRETPKYPVLNVSRSRVAALRLEVPIPATQLSAELVSAAQFCDKSQLELRDVTLWHQSIIRQGERQLLIDSGQDPRSLHVAGMGSIQTCGIYLDGKIPTQVPRFDRQAVDQAIYAGGRVDMNWFHFLVEGMPSILRAERGVPQNVPIAVRSDLPRTAFEILSLVTQRNFILLEDDTSLHVNKLYAAFRQATALDSLFSREMTTNFDRAELGEFRLRVLGEVPVDLHSNHFDKVLVLRNSHYRRLRNLPEVAKFLSRQGFVLVNTGQLSATDQVSIFNHAKKIVIQGGAAMGNLIFADSSAQIVVLVGPNGNQSQYWKSYCDALDLLNSQVISGAHKGRVIGAQGMHSDFRIPIDDLKFLRSKNH